MLPKRHRLASSLLQFSHVCFWACALVQAVELVTTVVHSQSFLDLTGDARVIWNAMPQLRNLVDLPTTNGRIAQGQGGSDEEGESEMDDFITHSGVSH